MNSNPFKKLQQGIRVPPRPAGAVFSGALDAGAFDRSGAAWTIIGTRKFAPEVADAWKTRLVALVQRAPTNLTGRTTLLNDLLEALGNFYKAANVNPHFSPAYIRPFTAAFGVSPLDTRVVGTNGGLAIQASAADSGLRGATITYAIPAGLNVDGNPFRANFAENPMRSGSPCAADNGTCVYRDGSTRVVPSVQMAIDFLKSVASRVLDQTIDTIYAESGNRQIVNSALNAPPFPPIGTTFEGGGTGGGEGGLTDRNCTPPQIQSVEEAARWNASHPSCTPVVFNAQARVCRYTGPKFSTQAQIDGWNAVHTDCPLPRLDTCVPVQPLTTEYERAAWRAAHPWCDDSVMFRARSQSSGGGLAVALVGAAALLWFATRS